MGTALGVVVIIGVFFLVGLAVGGIMVIALPVLRERRSRRNERREPGDRPVQPEHDHVAPDATGRDDAAPDDHHRRPGGAGKGHSGR
jgi:hypothetical protein